MRRARASRRSDPRAPSTTFAPRSASRSAVASPIPLLAPVITTTLPSILFSMVLYYLTRTRSATQHFENKCAHVSSGCNKVLGWLHRLVRHVLEGSQKSRQPHTLRTRT